MSTKPIDHQDSFRHITDFKSLQLKLASPDVIKQWSHGEVTKPETINYRTLRPEKDGLFDERIFGPVKDWECYCGKYKRIRYKGIICDKCGVEVTQSRVRRERMGHISLACPVAHVWYFKGAPSRLSLLLDVAPKTLESVIYFAQYIVTEIDAKNQAATLEKIRKIAEDAKAKIKSDIATRAAALQADFTLQIKDLASSSKNEDAKALGQSQLELKAKQQTKSLNDAAANEIEATVALYQRLTDIVKNMSLASIMTEDEYLKLEEHKVADFFTVGMGTEAILKVIEQQDLDKLAADLRQEIATTSGQRHIKATKRLRVVDGLRRAGINPAWMVLKILPVIPPDLRPMVQLSGGRFATSDLNDLYRRVINRNHRLKHLMDLGAPEIILRNEKRMLQEAVDSLIDSAQHATRITRRVSSARPRSLSDMLRGKQGRFRQNLLGKRVDYSGRSVIVVGPELKLFQCGLPKDMALEMFKPFVLRQMIVRGLAPNVKSAKNMLESRPPEVFDILEEITKNHPILLNRAPTLHKLSIQAFYPILIDGSAIRVHPCVCAGFNADFDGDQMAVHIPISNAAITEAKDLMLSEKNLRKPADGTPISIPSTKEMALGNYYMTSIDSALPAYSSVLNDSEAVMLYHTGRLKLRQSVKVRLAGEGSLIDTSVGRLLFNQILPEKLPLINEAVKRATVVSLFAQAFKLCPAETVAKMVDDIKNIGFWASTISGLSVSITDCIISPQRSAIISTADQAVLEIENNFSIGLITAEEKRRLSQEVWLETADKLADITWELIASDNPIRLMVDAQVGRVSRDQVRQLSAMRGLVVDPLGNIVDLPVKSNYRQGFSTFEYIAAARGERKGLSDTAIRTADAGYLTRRLVDVAHDAIIRIEDCNAQTGLTISKSGRRAKAFGSRLFGRRLSGDIVGKNHKVLIPAGTVLDENHISLISAEGIGEVVVRSPLTCNSRYGLCAACYGLNLASMTASEVGDPAGVVAAQSVGEPGTQMTLHGKRGGISAGGVDVTQGLPRVEELFEARTPKLVSPLAEISGKTEVVETDAGYKVRIRNTSVKPIEEREYLIPLTAELKIADGDLVTTGTQLAVGSLDIKEVLEVRGLRGAQEYLIEEIQLVYESQGIPIHDKHFEVIVRKMSDRVRILTSGDTSLLPGDILDRTAFEAENARILAAGGEPATAQIVILGITRAALKTASWLSAASFIETTSQLADAAIEGRVDPLLGLKENVIIGRLIPTSPDRAVIV